MRRPLLPALLSMLALGAAPSGDLPLPAPSSAQSLYELHVTLPGTRSQGVRGILLDPAGMPLDFVHALGPVDTPIGRFEAEGCQYLWSVCGWLRSDGYSPDHHGITNDPTREGPVLFRVLRPAGGEGAPWRGELFDVAGKPPADDVVRIDSAMGTFVRLSGQFGGQPWSGWIPLLWLPEDQRPR